MPEQRRSEQRRHGSHWMLYTPMHTIATHLVRDSAQRCKHQRSARGRLCRLGLPTHHPKWRFPLPLMSRLLLHATSTQPTIRTTDTRSVVAPQQTISTAVRPCSIRHAPRVSAHPRPCPAPPRSTAQRWRGIYKHHGASTTIHPVHTAHERRAGEALKALNVTTFGIKHSRALSILH